MDFPAIFLVGGFVTTVVGAFVMAVGHLLRAMKSRHWPQVAATILDAQVCQGGKAYRPQIRYSYVVAGRPYISDRIVVGWMLDVGGASAQRFVAQHAKGSSVRVAVDPRDATYSVLTPGVSVHQIFILVICSVLVCAVIGMLALAYSAAGTASAAE